MFARAGAVVIDADAIAREIVAPGTPALAAIERRFGSGVLQPDGALDRTALAEIVFADPADRAALNAITHPRIAERSAELLAAAPPDAVVVYDMPLLVEQGLAGQWDHVVVVEAPTEDRLERLVRDRGMSRTDAAARIAAQATDAERRAVADHVIVNDGSPADLTVRAQQVWRAITG